MVVEPNLTYRHDTRPTRELAEEGFATLLVEDLRVMRVAADSRVEIVGCDEREGLFIAVFFVDHRKRENGFDARAFGSGDDSLAVLVEAVHF